MGNDVLIWGRACIFQYLEVYYNKNHSAIDCNTPFALQYTNKFLEKSAQ